MSINHLQQTAQPAMTAQQAYPSGYPVQTPPSINPSQPRSNMTWVQGMEAAKSFAQYPNTTMSLWDTEKQCVYIRTTDINGFPRPLTVIDYTIRDEESVTIPSDTSDRVTRAEFDELKEMISDLKDSIAAQSSAQQKPHYNNKKGGRFNEKQSSV